MWSRIAVFLAGASLAAAQGVERGSKEFSIGPPTANHAANGPYGIRAEGMPLKRVLARAYGIPEHRILGPDWLATERYAIVARVNDPAELQGLLQQELTARFHMLVHRETKNVPVFVMKPAQGGAKLGAAPAGPPTLKMTKTTMAGLAAALSDQISRPVFDETGIDGRFDVSLSWKFGNVASLQAAMKEQLGLELVDQNRSVEFLVIDHIEKLQFPK